MTERESEKSAAAAAAAVKEKAESFRTIDWTAVRSRLAGRSGESLWRSLEELAETQTFRESVQREFPAVAPRWEDGVSRRNFIKLMAASLALAGMWGCSDRTNEKVVPYVHQPEAMVSGKPLFFATAMPFGGFGKGVLVHSREGRAGLQLHAGVLLHLGRNDISNRLPR